MKKIRSYAKVNASINILGKYKNKLHKIETFFFLLIYLMKFIFLKKKHQIIGYFFLEDFQRELKKIIQ